MRYSLLTQITLIGLSVIIFVTVIKPMFASISVIQDERLVYEDAVDKAQQFNMKLDELISIRDSFREEDMEKLRTFLPAEIDTMQVMRDVEAFFATTGVKLTGIALDGESSGNDAQVYIDEFGQEQVSTESQLNYQDVKVTFSGTYEEMLQILNLSERNETLLEVTKFTFGTITTDGETQTESAEGSDDEDTFNFDLVFRVYGLQKASNVAIESAS